MIYADTPFKGAPGRAKGFGVVLALGGLLLALFPTAALAGHEPGHTLRTSQTTTLVETGTDHTIGVFVKGVDQPLASTNVDYEFLGNSPGDPGDGADYGQPDGTCDVTDNDGDGEGKCEVTYTVTTAGTDRIRFWVDDDELDEIPDADLEEGVNNTADPGSLPEPDDTDVARVRWFVGVMEGASLDCEPEQASVPITESDGRQTYTCSVAGPQGDAISGAQIDLENLDGANDPDDSDGSEQGTTNTSPDYDNSDAPSRDFCVTDGSGACSESVSASEGETGDAHLCFWVDEDAAAGADDYSPHDVEERDGGRCLQEPVAESETPDHLLTDLTRITWFRPECSDNADNDNDGRLDADDPGCSAAGDDSESPDPDTTSYTRITIRKRFHGVVQAGADECVSDRAVVLKRIRRGRSNKVVGKDTTNEAGEWRINRPRARGRFYVVAPQSRVPRDDGSTVTCRWDRSRWVRRR